jgi:pyridoxine 5-phosphate synthase
MKRLGVNIDHIATLRNARAENHPNILAAAKYVMKCGADLITIHLREDRRHINDKDLKILSKIKSIPLNLEIAASYKMIKIALNSKPKNVCIVPEKRNEITTEGGLNLKKNINKLKNFVKILNKKNIRTSLFIDPNIENIKISKFLKVKCVEFHTGRISRKIKARKNFNNDLKNIISCTNYANSLGIEVHAGHGIDYKTAKVLSKIKFIKEFNIGHFIIGESIFYGLKNIIKTFKKICR